MVDVNTSRTNSDLHSPKPLVQLLRRELRDALSNLYWSGRTRLLALTRATYVHPRAHLLGAGDLTLDSHCQVYSGATLRSIGNRSPTMTVGRYGIIRENAYLDAHGGWIELAEGVFVGQNAVIYGQGGVAVGSNTLLSPGVTIISARHAFDRDGVPIKFQPETFAPVVIGPDCWLGANVTVLAGVTIEEGTVVGAGSVVTSDLPRYAVALGSPARVTRTRTP